MKAKAIRLPIAVCILLVSIISCKKSEQTSEDKEISAPSQVQQEIQDESVTPTKMTYTTKTGKSFEIETESQGESIMDISVQTKGFGEQDDTWKIEGSDPLTDTFIADLDANGFEELYLITTSAGSGSYAGILGYASNNDKSVTEISVSPVSESDLQPGGNFEGYMGHDSIYVDQGRLYRKFPKYLEGDENCCPSGGERTVEYALRPGEAAWILEPIK